MQPSANKSLTLDQVCQQFEYWRQTREKRCPIPEQLWQAAESLYPEYSIYNISKALRLNYTDLKKRIEPKQPAFNPPCINPAEFIEVKVNSAIRPAECLVEMKDPFGAKMRMHFKGEAGLDLLELGKLFLSRRSGSRSPRRCAFFWRLSPLTSGKVLTDWPACIGLFLNPIRFPAMSLFFVISEQPLSKF